MAAWCGQDEGERMKTPVMDALVEFVLGLELASLPRDVVAAAERSVTDWLGTALRGARERAVRGARQRRAVPRARLRRHAPAIDRPRLGVGRPGRARARGMASRVG